MIHSPGVLRPRPSSRLTGLPEVAFLGRSNVGKSSLLNALAGASGARAGFLGSGPHASREFLPRRRSCGQRRTGPAVPGRSARLRLREGAPEERVGLGTARPFLPRGARGASPVRLHRGRPARAHGGRPACCARYLQHQPAALRRGRQQGRTSWVAPRPAAASGRSPPSRTGPQRGVVPVSALVGTGIRRSGGIIRADGPRRPAGSGTPAAASGVMEARK